MFPAVSSATTRRQFLARAAAGAALLGWSAHAAPPPRRRPGPDDKLRLGVIGVGGRGAENLKAVASEHIAALCDVDEARLAEAGQAHPGAARFADWRRMLDRGGLDGVVVSTPDHTHAVIIAAALDLRLPVYAEKPLTHTVSEARHLLKKVARAGVPTQTGNQIHSGTNYRRVVELVQSGAIGDVREVHHWVGGGWEARPWPAPEPVPAGFDYDLWVGPAEWRDYSKEWVPFNWRRWWHWGGGTLADFCCHHMDLGVWALELGHPTRIEAEGPPPDAHCAPAWQVVRYDFPARKATAPAARRGTPLPPVRMTWYHGDRRPPLLAGLGQPNWGAGTLFVGERGFLLADYGRHLLLPEERFKDFARPAPFIPDSPGHHAEWLRACKGEGSPHSPFEYGLRLTELGLLGNAALRAGGAIEWDGRAGRAKNSSAAEPFLQHRYRAGWRLA